MNENQYFISNVDGSYFYQDGYRFEDYLGNRVLLRKNESF